RNVFSVEEAVNYYSWADESFDRLLETDEVIDRDPEWLAGFRLSYGKALMHLGKVGLASEQLEWGLKFCQNNDLFQFQGRLLYACGALSWSRGEYGEALRLCRSALQLLGESSDETERCRLYGLIGNINFSQGALDAAVNFYKESMRLARIAGDLAGEGDA